MLLWSTQRQRKGCVRFGFDLNSKYKLVDQTLSVNSVCLVQYITLCSRELWTLVLLKTSKSDHFGSGDHHERKSRRRLQSGLKENLICTLPANPPHHQRGDHAGCLIAFLHQQQHERSQSPTWFCYSNNDMSVKSLRSEFHNCNAHSDSSRDIWIRHFPVPCHHSSFQKTLGHLSFL